MNPTRQDTRRRQQRSRRRKPGRCAPRVTEGCGRTNGPAHFTCERLPIQTPPRSCICAPRQEAVAIEFQASGTTQAAPVAHACFPSRSERRRARALARPLGDKQARRRADAQSETTASRQRSRLGAQFDRPLAAETDESEQQPTRCAELLAAPFHGCGRLRPYGVAPALDDTQSSAAELSARLLSVGGASMSDGRVRPARRRRLEP